MKRSTIAAAIALGALAGCVRTDRMDGPAGAVTIPGDLFGLLLLGMVLYMALSSVIARLSREKPWGEGESFDLVSQRAVRRRTHADHHHGGLHLVAMMRRTAALLARLLTRRRSVRDTIGAVVPSITSSRETAGRRSTSG
jgi:hypothetical protein